jgi:hypothetical protein
MTEAESLIKWCSNGGVPPSEVMFNFVWPLYPRTAQDFTAVRTLYAQLLKEGHATKESLQDALECDIVRSHVLDGYHMICEAGLNESPGKHVFKLRQYVFYEDENQRTNIGEVYLGHDAKLRYEKLNEPWMDLFCATIDARKRLGFTRNS